MSGGTFRTKRDVRYSVAIRGKNGHDSDVDEVIEQDSHRGFATIQRHRVFAAIISFMTCF